MNKEQKSMRMIFLFIVVFFNSNVPKPSSRKDYLPQFYLKIKKGLTQTRTANATRLSVSITLKKIQFIRLEWVLSEK
jgi:hypothetical protein